MPDLQTKHTSGKGSLIPNIARKIREEKAKKAGEVWATYTVHASQAGHPCLAYLWYSIVHWRERQPWTADMLIRFGEGHLHEAAVLRDLSELGLDVIESQSHFSEFGISGRVDAVVRFNALSAILEIKSMSSMIWASIFGDGNEEMVWEWEDVAHHFCNPKRQWLQHYYAQIQVYMLAKNMSHGIFLFKNKGSGQIAQVNVGLDFSYAESILKKSETVHACVRSGERPDRIEFDWRTCSECAFSHLCRPNEVARDPYEYVTDEEVASWCDLELSNADAHKEHQAAHKELLSWAKVAYPAGGKVVVGGKYAIDIGANGRKTVKVSRL